MLAGSPVSFDWIAKERMLRSGMANELTSSTVAKSPNRTKAPKNPKRVAAGRLNHAKRRGLTPAGRERIRQTALRNKPWQHSTGPRTAAGKARSARNSTFRRNGLYSRSELRARLADFKALLNEMEATRRLAGG